MIRRAAIVILALTLNPALLAAQGVVLTVNVPSADVYKGPSNVTPVIGHVSRGTALPVLRDLGSWVKIAWPSAPDGIGYVHVTMGRIGPANATAPAASTSVRTPSAPAPPPTPLTRTTQVEHAASRGPVSVTPTPSHAFGVGGLVAPMNSVGATARAWRNNRLGIQFAFTRESMTSDIGAGRVTSTQFEPGVVYALFDRVSDYVWIRPYVGSTVSFVHQTSENGVGFRVFGGSELTFASLPQFGLSADLGYRRFPTLLPGFEPDPLSASIAIHWYMK